MRILHLKRSVLSPRREAVGGENDCGTWGKTYRNQEQDRAFGGIVRTIQEGKDNKTNLTTLYPRKGNRGVGATFWEESRGL